MMTERATYWRTDDLGEVEWLTAQYRTHRFARHWHEGYALGVIEAGAEAFTVAGTRHCGTEGSVVFVNPGEIHDGEAAHPSGWRYRMLYPAVAVLERAASELSGRPARAPLFRCGIVDDAEVAAMLVDAHRAAERSRSTLERESRLLSALVMLVRRYADVTTASVPAGSEDARMRTTRELIEDRLDEDLSLATLATAADLSAWHFLRLFRQATGATPHVYLLQRRLARARLLLQSGEPAAAVASATGFADQSHLTHRFRRAYGVTPARFQRAHRRSKKLQD